MAKRLVQNSLERDAYLFRHDDKEATRERLQKSVERLSKLMSLSETDKAELMDYADRLLEHRRDETQQKENQVRRRIMRSAQQIIEQTPSARETADGTQASDLQ